MIAVIAQIRRTSLSLPTQKHCTQPLTTHKSSKRTSSLTLARYSRPLIRSKESQSIERERFSLRESLPLPLSLCCVLCTRSPHSNSSFLIYFKETTQHNKQTVDASHTEAWHALYSAFDKYVFPRTAVRRRSRRVRRRVRRRVGAMYHYRCQQSRTVHPRIPSFPAGACSPSFPRVGAATGAWLSRAMLMWTAPRRRGCD